MAKRSDTPNFDEFRSTLERQDTQPVYAVVGDEEQLKAEAIVAIKVKALDGSDPAMCYTEYDGEEADCKDVFDELRTLPFLGKRRVVLVEKADRFVERAGEPIKTYLDSPAASGALILALKKLNRSTKLYKTLARWQSVVECKRLYENQVPAWVIQRARSRGKAMDAPAARMLAEHVGADLGTLANQIDKLITFVGEHPRITVDDVAQLTITDRTRTVFELTECIGHKDTRRALTILGQFMRSGDDASYILTMLAWQMRRLWKAKHVMVQNSRARERDLVGEVHKAVGGSRYFIKDIIRQAGAFSEDDMAYRYRLLLECDLQLKSTGNDPKTALEVLMMNLCR